MLKRCSQLRNVSSTDLQPFVEAYVVLSNPIEKERYDQTPDGEYDIEKILPSTKNPKRLASDIYSQIQSIRYILNADVDKAMTLIKIGIGCIVASFAIDIICKIMRFGGVVITLFVLLLILGGFIVVVVGLIKNAVARTSRRKALANIWDKIEV